MCIEGCCVWVCGMVCDGNRCGWKDVGMVGTR